MGTAVCRGITFNGTLQVQVDPSTMADGRVGSHRRAAADNYVVGIDQRRVNKGKPAMDVLWLLSPEMDFTGSVIASGNLAEIDQWQIGFIQTITRSERIAHYQGGRTWHMKLDMAFGPLKDGQKDGLFYLTTDRFKVEGALARANVRDQDAPNQPFPTTYSGDPNNPVGAGAGALLRTDGGDTFTTWLAATHHVSRSVVLLASSAWTVSWAGTFDALTRIWTPGAAAMNAHAESDVAAVHADLSNPGHPPVPFSMFMAEAEDSKQIDGPGGFRDCDGHGLPQLRGGANLTRWA